MNSTGVGRVANPSPDVVVQVVNRAASPDFEPWWAKVSESGFCAVPVHLAGRDAHRGAVEIMARCKNRRAAVCPSCSQLYAGDTWQLVHGGIGGDGDLPAAIGRHPMVFVTLTAPSFGPVHTASRDSDANSSRSCRPVDHDLRCTHGQPLACYASHSVADPTVGQPLCADCYDYIGHVLFTWYAPQLWHRFCVSLRRLVARHMRELGEDPSTVRVAYLKVVEMQRRAIPHFHSVIRLDAQGEPDEHLTPPSSAVDARELAVLVHRAAARARLRVSGPGGSLVTVRFGTQIDTQVLITVAPTGSTDPENGTGFGEVAGRRVAAYLAKYVTKSIADFGLGARRLHEAIIGELDVTDHIRRILYTISALGKLPEHQGIGAWLHTLGYRGHITTKTRRYSTTMGALRARREFWRQQQRDLLGQQLPGARNSRDEVPSGEWRYAGCGHANEGERLLAISAAGRAREMRRTAREELAGEP
jgi:hypothetical protein